MPEQLFAELIKYGGGTGIIVALIFLLREIARFTNRNNNKNNNKQMKDEVLKELRRNDLHDLEYIRNRLDKLEEKFNNLENRVIKIEVKMNEE